jgi:tetratricopeptide (TPR) repeat protein/glycosyltransferase involved in cell wall biosynthesis
MKQNTTISSLFDQALEYTDQKQYQLAIQSYDQIVCIQPDHAISYNNMGILFNMNGQFEKAEYCFDQATQIDPYYANAWFNWGNTLKDQKNFDLAIERYKMAIACNSTFAEAYNNMGDCFGEKNRFDLSLLAYENAIKINPKIEGVYYNIGNLYYRIHRYQRSLDFFKHSIAIQPDYKDAHYHMSFLYLIMGDYEKGFREYEWRLKRGPITGDNFAQPCWDGQPAKDKTLFVYSEQGFGDNIHFCRYLSMIAGKVKKIIFGAREEQVRLFKTISNVDEVIGQGEKLPQFDIHCSVMSLPYLFQTNAKTIPCNTPYFFPDFYSQSSELYEFIEKQAGDLLRVGIVWGGNPEYKSDKKRSIPLEKMDQLFKISGIRWFSFQKGLYSKSIKMYKNTIVDLSHYFEDFYDTAMGLSQMDLLITVDTSVAHLAGALGIPFWLMIPSQSDWRWLLDRSDSPWYPTCLIFRQAIGDDGWQTVLDQVCNALRSAMSDTPDCSVKKHFHEGLAQYRSQNYHHSCIAFQKVLSTNPISWEAEYNLSGLFAKQNFRHYAILFGQRACRRHTQKAQVWQHLGKQYIQCQDIHRAINCFGHAQQLSDFKNARINYDMGRLLLLNGQWQEGLQWYEYRRTCNILPERRKYDMPQWDGQPFKNKTLLLYSEFLGKSLIMYLRFAPLVKQLGGTVVLETTTGIYRLAMSALRVDRIFYYPGNQDSEPVSAFDIQASLESIPYLLNIPKHAIPHDAPYLQPKIRHIPLTSYIQSFGSTLKIGVSWFSEPSKINGYSQIISQLMPIFQLEDVTFFHIGYHPLSLIDSINIPDELKDLSIFLDDSHDMASAIAQMDVIVSFDNLVGHLAGAMSEKVYMILPHLPEWYWQMDSSLSHWYPSMRLFRVKTPSDGQTILQEMIERLSHEPHKKHGSTENLNPLDADTLYLHGIGYFEGLTGCHIHTRSFFDAIGAYMPVLESDIQLPKRLNISADYLKNNIISKNLKVFNLAICPIHQLDALVSCPGVKIGYVVWESTSIPDDWIKSLSHADILWTPSQWFRQILINHGMDSHSIQVIPEGINEQVFKPDGPVFQSLKNINAYKFLYVGKLEERKSPIESIVTFDYTFKDIPNVRLVLSTQIFKNDFDYKTFIQALRLRHPEKILCVGPFSKNSDLASLYRSCDAFVLPTRAEGWGLPIIEAMACGLPVIVTGYSGLTEFATHENAYLIDYKMADIEKPLGWQFQSNSTDYGQWAEPDFLHLKDIMQYVWKNKEKAKERGIKASHDILSHWTWDHAAKKAIAALTQLKDKSFNV